MDAIVTNQRFQLALQSYLKRNIIFFVDVKNYENIMIRFLKKYNIKDSHVMSATDPISPFHLFPSLFVSLNTSLTNKRGQLAAQTHLKRNIVYCVEGNNYEKITGRF